MVYVYYGGIVVKRKQLLFNLKNVRFELSGINGTTLDEGTAKYSKQYAYILHCDSHS